MRRSWRKSTGPARRTPRPGRPGAEHPAGRAPWRRCRPDAAETAQHCSGTADLSVQSPEVHRDLAVMQPRQHGSMQAGTQSGCRGVPPWRARISRPVCTNSASPRRTRTPWRSSAASRSATVTKSSAASHPASVPAATSSRTRAREYTGGGAPRSPNRGPRAPAVVTGAVVVRAIAPEHVAERVDMRDQRVVRREGHDVDRAVRGGMQQMVRDRMPRNGSNPSHESPPERDGASAANLGRRDQARLIGQEVERAGLVVFPPPAGVRARDEQLLELRIAHVGWDAHRHSLLIRSRAARRGRAG